MKRQNLTLNRAVVLANHYLLQKFYYKIFIFELQNDT